MTEKGALIVTGATGVVGRALARRQAYTPLPRRAPPAGGPWWEPSQGCVHDCPARVRAVIHLAGAPVAAGRWTKARKAAILDSRVQGTRTLVDWMATLGPRPPVFICASAIGLYGDCGEAVLTEEDTVGTGFLAEVVEAWEAEARRAESLGIRVVRLRIGVALSTAGGALAEMLPIFRWGLGGPLGGGRQWFPWVHIDDVVTSIEWALDSAQASGAYNVVSPGICRQAEFARALGSAIGRPAFLPAPRFALRIILGSMADEVLLGSTRVHPTRLQAAGFTFAWPELDAALADALS